MGKNWGDAKLLGKVVEKPVLKEYPANELLGVIQRMAYLECVISALEDAKKDPLFLRERRCRIERVPTIIESEDGGHVRVMDDDFWRRNAGKTILVFHSTGATISDDYVLHRSDKLTAEIWRKAQESALFHAHEEIEQCRTRLKEVRETLLSDEALKDIILRDETNAKA